MHINQIAKMFFSYNLLYLLYICNQSTVFLTIAHSDSYIFLLYSYSVNNMIYENSFCNYYLNCIKTIEREAGIIRL